MQVSVEKTGTLERVMRVEVPEERIQSEINNRLKNLARTTQISGFRAGKVPFNIVKKRYEGMVRQEVVGEVLQNSLYEAIMRENLRVAGMPLVDAAPYVPGKTFAYTAKFEIYPEIQLKPCDDLVIEKPVAEISEQDIDQMIDKIRQQRASWTSVERAAKMDDRITIDFKGTINGEEFKGNAGKGVPVELGRGRMIAGFEEQLVGLAAGQEKVLDLSFPADYHFKEVAGKPVQFSVKAYKVEEAAMPEVNEEFIKSLGVADGNLAEFRQQLKKSMSFELERAIKSKVKQQVADAMTANNQIHVPNALIEQEINASKQRMGLPESYQLPSEQRASFEEAARKRVATGLLFSEIVRVNNLRATPERLRQEIDLIANSYEDPQEVISWYYGDRNRLGEIESLVLEDIVVDWVLDHAKVKEVTRSFDDMTKQQ